MSNELRNERGSRRRTRRTNEGDPPNWIVSADALRTVEGGGGGGGGGGVLGLDDTYHDVQLATKPVPSREGSALKNT